MDKLYIVIPAYNEEANIEAVVGQWYPIVQAAGPESRLLVVNDGSKDSTGQKLEQLAARLPALLPFTKENGGHGPACLFGYQKALEAGADYIFQTDSDGQTLPEEFAAFWEKREEYDMVIGHRAGRQDGFSRLVVTKVLKRPLLGLGRLLGVNDAAAAGLVATLANSIATFRLVQDMDSRGKVVNIAFAVSAAFVFGDHLGFTAGFAPEMLPAVIAGKLSGGVAAVLAALWLTRKAAE